MQKSLNENTAPQNSLTDPPKFDLYAFWESGHPIGVCWGQVVEAFPDGSALAQFQEEEKLIRPRMFLPTQMAEPLIETLTETQRKFDELQQTINSSLSAFKW